MCAPAAFAERLVAADSSNRLYTFDSAGPEQWTRTKAVTGLGEGERIVGPRHATRRPRADRTDAGQPPVRRAVHQGDRDADRRDRSRHCSPVRRSASTQRTVDRIRVVSASGQNLRLHPETEAVAFADGALRYKEDDPRDGKAYVLAHRPGTDRSRLFSINLGKGTARKLGTVRRRRISWRSQRCPSLPRRSSAGA